MGVLCMALFVLAVSVADTLKGDRLLDWLRNPEADAPALPGMWGEVAHGIQRVLRQREQALADEREQHAQFLSGIEASPNGVILLDATEHIVWISSVAASHFGLDSRRDLAQRITNLIRVPAFVQYLTDGHYEEPVNFIAHRGAPVMLSVNICTFGEGQRLVLSQDITERDRSERMRRDFVANVSHEIRTPLTVLTGFIETLKDLPLTNTERARVLVLMQQQSERLQALVADLLTLAQIEGSPQPARDRWMSVESLWGRLESDARALSGERHQIAFNASGVPLAQLELAGVESEWLSGLGNLVSNAIRYTPEGGQVTVCWSQTPDGGASYAVTDSGIGIAAEHLPRLTERFYRVDGSRSRETGGTGLGLAIVKHVVQRHGGELHIASEPGKGSTFTITIPATRLRAHAQG